MCGCSRSRSTTPIRVKLVGRGTGGRVLEARFGRYDGGGRAVTPVGRRPARWAPGRCQRWATGALSRSFESPRPRDTSLLPAITANACTSRRLALAWRRVVLLAADVNDMIARLEHMLEFAAALTGRYIALAAESGDHHSCKSSAIAARECPESTRSERSSKLRKRLRGWSSGGDLLLLARADAGEAPSFHASGSI